MSRRLVVRMDILPHLEMISVQRVGAFGVIYSKLYRIQDLEYVPFEAIKDNGKTEEQRNKREIEFTGH